MNLRCEGCGAQLTLEPELRTALCPYCGSTSIVERPAETDRPTPAFALGFAVSRGQVHESARAWLGRRSWFAKSGVRKAALEHLQGIYLPAYLYSSVAHVDYRAEIGEHYTETETYSDTENGKKVTKTRRVTKTEWHPLSGRLDDYVADTLVTASKGLPNSELGAVEPFDLRQLRRFQPALLSGWLAEEPTLTQPQCLELARAEMRRSVESRLRGFLPGDEQRGLSHTLEVAQESLELCLLPVWVLAARYAPDSPPMRIVVNGQTGKTTGKVPLSWTKIAAAALGAALVAGGLVYLLLLQKP
ncbi:MAG: hypothetical protein HY901_20720 [Deltaproteobacteria bacterium]|nr:hypothetical protein [Deltaproteobacteria bacterium]